jgi:L-ascorbate metabolism protein UlaG (beta-lactamase superfamily)
MKFQWFGGSTFLLEIGDFKLLSDPFIGGKAAGQVSEPRPVLDVQQVDAVLVSSVRSGPLDAEAARHLKNDLRILAPALQAVLLSELGFTCVSGLGWWQVFAPRKGRASLHIQAAPAMQTPEAEADPEHGKVNGYLITHSGPDGDWRAYWTGETDWHAGLQEVRARAGVLDLLILNLEGDRRGPGVRGSFSPDEAARVVRMFEPRLVIPVSPGGPAHFGEAVAQLQRSLSPGPLAERIAILREGQSVSLRGMTP